MWPVFESDHNDVQSIARRNSKTQFPQKRLVTEPSIQITNFLPYKEEKYPRFIVISVTITAMCYVTRIAGLDGGGVMKWGGKDGPLRRTVVNICTPSIGMPAASSWMWWVLLNISHCWHWSSGQHTPFPSVVCSKRTQPGFYSPELLFDDNFEIYNDAPKHKYFCWYLYFRGTVKI